MPIRKSLQGIQSVEIASRLLRALANHRRPMALGKLAADAHMTSSKARRYLVSLCRAELVQQDPDTGLYAPGALAFDLGNAALARREILPLALPIMRALRDELNETVSLLLWGPKGPTVVHYEESDQPVRLNTSVGSVLPLVTSASGRIFAAFGPRERVDPLVREELKALRKRTPVAPLLQRFPRDIEEIRARGLTRADGTLLPTVSGMGAPVFDANGTLVAGLVVIGHHGALDVRWGGRVAGALAKAAHNLSTRLGA